LIAYILNKGYAMGISWLVTKYLTTAFVIVLVSEIARRSDKLGALVAALPLVTIFALIWLQVETGSAEKVSNHAWYTFWYVVPTLPMFLVFPSLLSRFGFWGALAANALTTAICFWLFAQLVKQFGIDLSI
tara:strand:+ start:3344 stop:3736 length:393 start_codon:yes stop_codon:yes gene_type:complete